ncbi:MAG: hypothetical protein JWM46_916 [Candidatus Kaiserbacteria bacterium]|nr:hypothetical protein [Candidatus Kaiserbacteria bacterium]
MWEIVFKVTAGSPMLMFRKRLAVHAAAAALAATVHAAAAMAAAIAAIAAAMAMAAMATATGIADDNFYA